MNFFCEIIIKEQYHLFEKKFPDISEINKINGDSFLLFVYQVRLDYVGHWLCTGKNYQPPLKRGLVSCAFFSEA